MVNPIHLGAFRVDRSFLLRYIGYMKTSKSLVEGLMGRLVRVSTTIVGAATEEQYQIMAYEGYYLGEQGGFTYLGVLVRSEKNDTGVFDVSHVINNNVITTIEVLNEGEESVDVSIDNNSVN